MVRFCKEVSTEYSLIVVLICSIWLPLGTDCSADGESGATGQPQLASRGPLDATKLQQIDLLIEATMKCSAIPGLAISLVRGNWTFTKGYGVANKERNEPVTGNTKFCIGSLTKAFTSTLVAGLLEKSKKCNNYIILFFAVLYVGSEFFSIIN